MEDFDISEMEKRFNKRLNELLTTKHHNAQINSKEGYINLIEKVKQSRIAIPKAPSDYRRIRRYDIVTFGDSEKLVVPSEEGAPKKLYIYAEELFKILHNCHLALGHGGRCRMEKELNGTYRNITREVIALYLNLCEVCSKRSHSNEQTLLKKLGINGKDAKVKPFIIDEINSKCRVDVVDVQLPADGEFNYILLYQDYLTKFVQLRPLRTNRVKEVAYVLVDIFTIFGAPSILQSINGREFASNVVEELSNMWNELKLIHGDMQNSEKQGSVERAHHDIENLVTSWLDTNNSNKWSEGLKFVQFMKNRQHQPDLGCSPYEVMFGSDVKLGLKSFFTPEVVTNVETEEDLQKFLKSGVRHQSHENAGEVDCTKNVDPLNMSDDSEIEDPSFTTSAEMKFRYESGCDSSKGRSTRKRKEM